MLSTRLTNLLESWKTEKKHDGTPAVPMYSMAQWSRILSNDGIIVQMRGPIDASQIGVDELTQILNSQVEIIEVEPEIEDWRSRFTETCDSPPSRDYILRAQNDKKIRIAVLMIPGQRPLLYTRAYVPTEVGGPTEWFAESTEIRAHHGWRVLLLPKARDSVIAKLGLKAHVLELTALRVINQQLERHTLQAEVEEW